MHLQTLDTKKVIILSIVGKNKKSLKFSTGQILETNCVVRLSL